MISRLRSETSTVLSGLLLYTRTTWSVSLYQGFRSTFSRSERRDTVCAERDRITTGSMAPRCYGHGRRSTLRSPIGTQGEHRLGHRAHRSEKLTGSDFTHVQHLPYFVQVRDLRSSSRPWLADSPTNEEGTVVLGHAVRATEPTGTPGCRSPHVTCGNGNMALAGHR